MSDMTPEQLATIAAVWNSTAGQGDVVQMANLMNQYGVGVNDVMAAVPGLTVGDVSAAFYGSGNVPDGWGGLPPKSDWYSAAVAPTNNLAFGTPALTTAEAQAQENFYAVADDTSVSNPAPVTAVTGALTDTSFMFENKPAGVATVIPTYAGSSTGGVYQKPLTTVPRSNVISPTVTQPVNNLTPQTLVNTTLPTGTGGPSNAGIGILAALAAIIGFMV